MVSDRGGGRSRVANVAMLVFKSPQRDDKCRICVTLDGLGDTRDLYDSHTSNYPTGCPRFQQMTTEERLRIATKAKLCLRCHDPNFVYQAKRPGLNKVGPRHSVLYRKARSASSPVGSHRVPGICGSV